MRKTCGFTLIEVLIALVILSIALTAIIKATSQNIRDTTYIQTKMAAHYVALDVINTARAGLINLPDAGSQVENDTEMLNQEWHWQLVMKETANQNIKEIRVSVLDKMMLT